MRSGDTVANAFTTHSPILTCDMHNCILHASETLKLRCLGILSKNTIIEKTYALRWEHKAKVKVLQSSVKKSVNQSCFEAKIIDYFNYLSNIYADC